MATHLNKQQMSAVMSNSAIIVVMASPGSGKTRVLIERIKRRHNEGFDTRAMVILTYTNAAAWELKQRLGSIPIGYCGTLHGYCFRLLQRYGSTIGYREGSVTIVPEGSTEDMLMEIAGRMKIKISYRKLTENYRPGSQCHSAPNGEYRDAALIWQEYAHTLKRNNLVDFDGILRDGLRIIKSGCVTDVAELYVDECQDSSAEDWAIYLNFPAPMKFYVGDPDQCQPTGTRIRMSDGREKPIEEIIAGDSVVSYERHGKVMMRSAKVSAVARRPYNGILYTVSTEDGKQASCTGNHRWLIKWLSGAERNRDLWCVYLMRKWDRFRVGKTCVFRSGGGKGDVLGLILRMRQEGADSGWILSVHGSANDALAQEDIISATFGLPQTCFNPGNKSVGYTKEVIDRIFTDLGSQLRKASQCLQFHGRELNHPLFDRRQARTRRTIQEIHACNLISGIMRVPTCGEAYDSKKRAGNWVSLNVSSRSFRGDVFSLDVEKYHKYVANGIVTCNSIYAFRGGDPTWLINLAQSGRVETILLETNYRSDVDICRAANALIAKTPNRIHKVMYPESKEAGLLSVESFVSDASETSYIVEEIGGRKSVAVLARTNSIAQNIKDDLRRHGILTQAASRVVMPSDWQKALLVISLILDPNDIVVERFLKLTHSTQEVHLMKLKAAAGGKSLAGYSGHLLRLSCFPLNKVSEFLSRKGVGEESIQLVEQRIKLLPQDEPTVSDLLQDLYSHDTWDSPVEDTGVFVGTIHSAKGREWDTVFLPGWEEGVLPFQKGSEDEERRLAFVGITRTRHKVIISHVLSRSQKWGAPSEQEKSRFIEELK